MVLTLLLVVCAGVWTTVYSSTTVHAPVLTVTFLDVGQGDATLIEAPGGAQVLIDGGATAGVLRELATALPHFDRSLSMVIATHPDTDHVGGLVDVLARYDVDHILMTENEGDSPAAQAFARAAQSEGVPITMARRGQLWHLDASTTLEVLFPETDPSDMETNAASIVLKLSYGETCMLLTGDSPKRIEEYLVLTYGEHLQCDVLKVGHHGSRTSTSHMFVQQVSPRYAVISAGQDNRYGHPHVEVTDLLFNERVHILETAVLGSVTIVSDGEIVNVE